MQDCAVPMRADDKSWPDDSALRQMNNFILEAGSKMGRPVDVVQKYKQLMIDAGFENVVEIVYKWPTNTWPKALKFKELGAWSLENFDSGLEGMIGALFTRVLGWTHDEVHIFLVDVRKDLRNKHIHAYWPM
jgi:hypothetical protein